MRVSMSATGSVNLILVSPHVARLLQPKYAAEEPAATSYAPCGILPQGRSCARRREVLTRTTSKHLESRHATRGYGSTGDIPRTCGGKRVGVRRSGSGCACATKTSACVRPLLVLLS